LNLTGALDTTIELDKIFKLHGAVHLEELQIIVLAGNHKFYYLQYGNPSSFHQLYIEFSLAKGFSTSERKITAALQIFYGRWLATDLTGEIIPDAENGLHDTNTHRQNILPVDPALMEECVFFQIRRTRQSLKIPLPSQQSQTVTSMDMVILVATSLSS